MNVPAQLQALEFKKTSVIVKFRLTLPTFNKYTKLCNSLCTEYGVLLFRKLHIVPLYAHSEVGIVLAYCSLQFIQSDSNALRF